MITKSSAILLGIALCVSAACDDDSPTTPTGSTIIVYQDTNFRGDSRGVIGNLSDLDEQPGCGGPGADWDDCISSIRVPSGWEVIVYENDQYSGASATFTADIPDLERQSGPCGGDWDDCISSIQIRQR